MLSGGFGIEIALLITIVSITAVIYFGVANLTRNQRLDEAARRAKDKEEVASIAKVVTQLDHIDKSIRGIEYDMRYIKDDIKEQRERLVKVEESAKSAHKRIDEMSRRGIGDN